MAPIRLTYEVARPPRWNTFFAGLLANVVFMFLFVIAGQRLTHEVSREPVVSSRSITLVAPITAPVVQKKTPISAPAVTKAVKLEPPKLEPTQPAVVKQQPQQQIEPPKPELPKVAAAVPPSLPAKPVPPVEVKTGAFDKPKSEPPSVHQLPRDVQTGGFGDPSGIAAKADPNRENVKVASIGSFDLPSGAGKGNGLAGSSGVSGTVRNSGFGGAPAATDSHAQRTASAVAPSGFGSPVTTADQSGKQHDQKPQELQPVEILFKPRPAYTPEALRQKVEGEVLLDVVFTASGSLHVNRVVKGLGYGLDDMALAAAQRIRFRPARRDGQPYDCAALVHMVFELTR